MENKKGTFVNVGQIWKRKEGDGSYIKLGNNKSNNPKYNYSVEIVVKDANGQEVLRIQDPYINVGSPHPMAQEKVPSLLAELSILKK